MGFNVICKIRDLRWFLKVFLGLVFYDFIINNYLRKILIRGRGGDGGGLDMDFVVSR